MTSIHHKTPLPSRTPFRLTNRLFETCSWPCMRVNPYEDYLHGTLCFRIVQRTFCCWMIDECWMNISQKLFLPDDIHNGLGSRNTHWQLALSLTAFALRRRSLHEQVSGPYPSLLPSMLKATATFHLLLFLVAALCIRFGLFRWSLRNSEFVFPKATPCLPPLLLLFPCTCHSTKFPLHRAHGRQHLGMRQVLGTQP